MREKRVKPYELECGHVLWFRIAPRNQDELLWCNECKTERLLLAATVALAGAWTYYPEWDFKSRRIKKTVFDAHCTYMDETGECMFLLHNIWGFNILRNMMHSHYMREHTNRGIEIRYGNLTHGSNPPF